MKNLAIKRNYLIDKIERLKNQGGLTKVNRRYFNFSFVNIAIIKKLEQELKEVLNQIYNLI